MYQFIHQYDKWYISNGYRYTKASVSECKVYINRRVIHSWSLFDACDTFFYIISEDIWPFMLLLLQPLPLLPLPLLQLPLLLLLLL